MRQACYQTLLAASNGDPNSRWMAQIIASWLHGDGVLPDYLGLTDVEFEQLLQYFFPNYASPLTGQRGKILDFSRMLEKQDLEQYLRQFAVRPQREAEWLINLLVAACLGNDHLWQDMGLFNRAELSALLNYNFPDMATRNTGDMKWKKFIYKQLCEAEGIYVCRAPSCEVCKDYPVCFGPEH